MFRGRNRLVTAEPRDGRQVVCAGAVTVYPARGDLQMVVEGLVNAGEGDLQKAFDALKARLAAEGLFAEERKRPLPSCPRSVGIVTSATGAAIQDILNVLKRRAPDVHILLKPVQVQGEEAAAQIAEAIEDLNRYGGVDVLIVGRGGGSVEDLWAFNEEVVARAIAASQRPVISAVGHETDFTIADLVADLRAPTPSAAAELVARNRQEREAHLDHLIMRLHGRMEQTLGLITERLTGLEARLRLFARDFAALPGDVATLDRRLQLAMAALQRHAADRLGLAAGRLDAFPPLKQLQRGYAIASLERDGKALNSVAGLSPDEQVWLRFADGRVRTRVEDVEE